MSDETKGLEKAKKTSEQIKAENEQRNKLRVERTLMTLKSAESLKGDMRTMLLKSISGQTNFMLTKAEWDAIIESKELKPAFVEECLSDKYKLVRVAASRAAGSEREPVDLVGGFRNVTKASVNEEGVVINEVLANAGKRVRAALDAFEKANEEDLKILLASKLELMFYIRAIKEEKKEDNSTTQSN